MLRDHLDRFLRDERGGYTIWGLTWFMLYVGIGGLAVDITDAYRNQTLLQATADAAALAGIMSPLGDENEVDTWAVTYAEFNMQRSVNGDVLKTTDVDIGTWNFTDRTFSVGGANPNAVRAITRRDATNANPVATNFLRIIGLQTWNVSAQGIASKGIDKCFNNGIIAGGALDVKTHIEFYDEICLIGHEKFWFRDNGTTFEDGVYVGAGCYDTNKKCIGPGNQVMKNDDFLNAFDMESDGTGGNYEDRTLPQNAMNLNLYINAVLSIASYDNFAAFQREMLADSANAFVDYSGYEYLANAQGVTAGESVPVLPDVLAQYTVYDLDCPSSGYVLPEGTYDHVAVIADCPISFATGGVYNITNSLIVSTYQSNGNNASISGSAKINLGTAGCGGGNEMYSLGNINFASDGQFANLRILADGDVHFAASSDSPSGVNIQATGDVFLASGSNSTSQYGLCADAGPVGAQTLTIALVH
jgi:hypothetical protein